MLLVLLPAPRAEVEQPDSPARVQVLALLEALQQQVGPSIRVLPIDEDSHPAVVHSFASRGLPAFVLVRDGVELWGQQGLPEGDQMAQQLLSKLLPAA
jgi:thioredoxin-like negative regulator of GroEL